MNQTFIFTTHKIQADKSQKCTFKKIYRQCEKEVNSVQLSTI